MEVKQLSFSYDSAKNILHEIDCTIESGKITTIIGPNGCGKSTLLGILSKNYSPYQGEVIIDGKEICHYSPKEFAQKLAVVHQQNEAPIDLTVDKLSSFGRLPHRTLFGRMKKEDEDAIEWALSCTNLQKKRNQRLNELSGGEKQRVWIAISLAQKTPILFLDEPTTYLDIYYQLEILELVKILNKAYGFTIVMVLHDINQALRYSDYIFAMKDGKVVKAGEPDEVITEKMMKKVYDVEVVIKRDDEVGLYIIPKGI